MIIDSDCLCEFEAECSGTGILHCLGCGGDLCICQCGGEQHCPGCSFCAEPFEPADDEPTPHDPEYR